MARAFDRERGIVAGEADADAFVGVGKEVALAEATRLTDDLGAPGITDEEEFAFDFQGAVWSGVHGAERRRGIGGKSRFGNMRHTMARGVNLIVPLELSARHE